MIKILTAGIVATTLLGGTLHILGTETEVMASVPSTSAKGDRLDIRSIETTCGQQIWPYYHHACLLDLRNSDGRARKVRVISSADRMPATKFVTHLSK